MRRIAIGLATVALAVGFAPPLAGSDRAGGPKNTWAGVWNTDFGKLTMDASGSGHYEGFNPGDIKGRVTGNVNEGTWAQPGDPPKEGTFKFTLSADGHSFSGTWAYKTGGCGSACGWSGTCASGPCTKNGTSPTTTTTTTPQVQRPQVQTVRFLFTQGGLPKGAPDTLLDVRTVGTGSITFVNPTRTDRFEDIKKATARIVRELDFVVRDPDTGIALKDRRLTLRPQQPLGHILFYQAEENDPSVQLYLPLEVASSTDPDCPATKGGKGRPAEIRLQDGAGKKPDAVTLLVLGCPHHNAIFTGTKRVKVAIVHKK